MIKIVFNFVLFTFISTFIATHASKFEWDLVKKSISTDAENAVVSPFSIEIILSLVAEALDVESETFTEMVNFIPGLESMIRYRRNMNATLKSITQNDLTLATRFFVKKHIQIEKTYQKLITAYYDADVLELDFNKNNQSVKLINAWVKGATGGNIPELLSSGDINSDLVAIIINAIHFKSTWKYPFEPSSRGTFYLDSGEKLDNVDFMSQNGDFNFYASPSGEKILSLPFVNEKFSMFFLLPDSQQNLNDFIQQISSEKVENMESQMEMQGIEIKLPKFKFTHSTDVKNVLEELNIRKLFTEKDLPGLTDNAVGIDKIIQKAGISMDEHGAEAYAATQIDIGIRIDSESFIATRPFLFYIKETGTNKVLFAGKVSRPIF